MREVEEMALRSVSAWEEDYATKLVGAGFRRGASAPTVFYCEDTKVRCVVHGDDFTFLGHEEDLIKIRKRLKSGSRYVRYLVQNAGTIKISPS